MNSEEIRAIVAGRFPDAVTGVPRERRVMIQVTKERLLEVLGFLHGQGLTHATAITGVDLIGENAFEILYHLYWGRNMVIVRTKIPGTTRSSPPYPQSFREWSPMRGSSRGCSASGSMGSRIPGGFSLQMTGQKMCIPSARTTW